MWSRNFRPGSPTVLIIVGLSILLLSILYVYRVYQINIYPDLDARNNFQKIDCLIVNKKLSVKNSLITCYRADFLISYTIKDTQYQHWVSGNGLDLSFSQNMKTQEKMLLKHKIGGTYSCLYNPAAPETAVLVLRHRWLTHFPLVP